MSQEAFIYSFVARGTMILAEYTEFTGNFPAIAAQCLQRLTAANNRFTYNCDQHTFNSLVEDGYAYCVVAKNAVGKQISLAFLERTKADFKSRYGGGQKSQQGVWEHMKYIIEHAEEIEKLLKVKAQVLEVKSKMLENIDKSQGCNLSLMAGNMVLPSTIERIPKKICRKHLYNSEHDDRLSELSEDLLVRILCLLPLKEALRTCVLSRRWRYLCQFFSGSLNFDASSTDPKNLLKEREGYVGSVTRFLNSHKPETIDELRVCFDLTQQHRRFINQWIDIAVMKKVKRLELDFEPCRLNNRRHRDSENYLFGWKFSSSSEIRFLTGLCLKHVVVSGQILESFLSNCPLLETLNVAHSNQLTHINVCGPSLRLKHLHISFCNCIKSIEVHAPNLVSFEYRGEENIAVHINLKHVPQLCDVSYAGQWEQCVVTRAAKRLPSFLPTSQLVNLRLQSPSIKRLLISIQPLEFPNLRYLTYEVRIRWPQSPSEFIGLLMPVLNMHVLHKLKFEVEAEMLTEEDGRRPIIKARSSGIINGRAFGDQLAKRLMLREVEIVGFVGAAADTCILLCLIYAARDLDTVVINRRDGDECKMEELEERRRFALELLSRERPEGAKYVVL
ncbi:hypothetical protein V6N12_033546 [Hibiscus sabdariffa]|uniref:Longin domain-containing protein n=1 Tax=Hibiscus sabdariffa TaxID=183260 RepID=A0ABR2BWE5_9ROSI